MSTRAGRISKTLHGGDRSSRHTCDVCTGADVVLAGCRAGNPVFTEVYRDRGAKVAPSSHGIAWCLTMTACEALNAILSLMGVSRAQHAALSSRERARFQKQRCLYGLAAADVAARACDGRLV